MTSLIVGRCMVGCHARALWPNGASYSYYGTLIGNPTPEIQWYKFRPSGVTPNRGMGPREALFVKLLWPLVPNSHAHLTSLIRRSMVQFPAINMSRNNAEQIDRTHMFSHRPVLYFCGWENDWRFGAAPAMHVSQNHTMNQSIWRKFTAIHNEEQTRMIRLLCGE